MKKLFTSESVTEGHPDKICDLISDSILDEIYKQDSYARVACETTATTDLINVMGEITSNAVIDIPKIIRKTVLDIGYNKDEMGFNANTCKINVNIDEQSKDISMGVNNSYEDSNLLGAGDQGMMFGFACDETSNFMPMPIELAHKLARRLTKVRKDNILNYLRPDGKTQVTIEYDDFGNPARVDTIVISTQHSADISLEELKKDILENVINVVIPNKLMDKETKIFINPTGRFVIGGPNGDSGLTGRKIIVDTYGGYSRHGGGAFSGKDPTKVDRSAAYMARYIAKNIVASKLARKCEIQLAYAIGVANPVSIMIDTFGTGKKTEEELVKIIENNFDLTPNGIISELNLRKPIYKQTAAYGHFGREDLDLSWEKIDKKLI